MNLPNDGGQRSTGKQVWLLLAVFAVPLALAFLLYYGGGWRPAGSTNRGELIHPARPLPEVGLPTVSGEPLAPGAWQGKWTLVYIGDGTCDARCREALTLMRQTRLALNDDMARVQRVLLATDDCCDLNYLETEHAGLLVARAVDADAEPLLAAFSGAGAQLPTGHIYLVDPLGNLMMRYTPEAPDRALLDDLKKLLKLSHIG